MTIKWLECRFSQCCRKMQSIYDKPITFHNLLWSSSKTFFVGASEHLQSWKKIWDTLVFIRNSALWEKSNFYFSEAFFASIDKICILWGRLDTKFSFYELLGFCCFLISLYPKSEVALKLVKQLVYAVFISNNYALFHLWWKKNLVNKQIGSLAVFLLYL